MSMHAALRQFRFPREFRIYAAPWPPGLEQLLAGQEPPPVVESGPPEPPPAAPDVRFLADVGTGLWRLRQKMVKPGTTQPLEEMRRPYRHLESVWDALTQAGAEIQDHTDTSFDHGMSLKVIAFQPTPGLGRERVIETIKPTVYFKGKTIQMGEVIVGVPEKDAQTAQPQGKGPHGADND